MTVRHKVVLSPSYSFQIVRNSRYHLLLMLLVLLILDDIIALLRFHMGFPPVAPAQGVGNMSCMMRYHLRMSKRLYTSPHPIMTGVWPIVHPSKTHIFKRSWKACTEGICNEGESTICQLCDLEAVYSASDLVKRFLKTFSSFTGKDWYLRKLTHTFSRNSTVPRSIRKMYLSNYIKAAAFVKNYTFFKFASFHWAAADVCFQTTSVLCFIFRFFCTKYQSL